MRENVKRPISKIMSVVLLFALVISCLFCVPVIKADAFAGGGHGTWVTGNAKTVTSTWSYYRAGIPTSYVDKLEYDIYLPAGYDESKQYSLLLFLHGSLYSMSDQYDFARFTKFNAVADANDIIVVYPRQSITLNPIHSWNFWASTDQCRTSGYTPATMVEYVKQAINDYSVDESKVFVGGISAGGAYAISMLALYPDVFSAACAAAGLPFKATNCSLDAVAEMYDNSDWGGYTTNVNTLANNVNAAFSQAGVNSTRRLLLIHGTSDSLVDYSNGRRCVESWVGAMQKYDSSVTTTPTIAQKDLTTVGGSTYDVEYYGGTTLEDSVVAFYTVQGMDHAWPGSSAATTNFGFSGGPDANELMVRFFLGDYVQPDYSDEEIVYHSDPIVPSYGVNNVYNWNDYDNGSVSIYSGWYYAYDQGYKYNGYASAQKIDVTSTNPYYLYYGNVLDYPTFSAYLCYDVQSVIDSLPALAENCEREIESITVSTKVFKDYDDANTYASDAAVYYTFTSSAWSGKTDFPKNGYHEGESTYGGNWTATPEIVFDIEADEITSRYLTLRLNNELGVWTEFPQYMKMGYYLPTVVVNYVDTYVESVDPIQSVSYDIDDSNKLTFTVVTDTPYTKVKLMSAEDTSVSIATTNSYKVNSDGFNEFTMTVDAPEELTMYYIDCGNSSGYTNEYYSCIVEGVAEESPVLSATYSILEKSTVFTVITKEGYSKLKIFSSDDANQTAIKSVTSYIDNGNGTYAWTISIDTPENDTTYGFDVSKNDGIYSGIPGYCDVTGTGYIPEEVIRSFTNSVENNMVTFKAVTSPDFDRIKIVTELDTETDVALLENYEIAQNGDYVWTVTTPAPSKTTVYKVDARSKATETFIGADMSTTVEISAPMESCAINSVTYTIENSSVIFKIRTPKEYNRVKVASPENPNGYITYTNARTDIGDEYEWSITLDAPEEIKAYYFDARSSETKLFTGCYKIVTVDPNPSFSATDVIKSVSSEIGENGDILFTIVTKKGAYDRLRVGPNKSTSGNLATTSQYTINGDGDFVWVLSIDRPLESEYLYFDLKNPSTGKYSGDCYKYYLDLNSLKQSSKAIDSVSYSTENGKVTFTVTTSTAVNRVKISAADDTASYIKYTNKYTVNEHGRYVWNIVIDQPAGTTVYAFDVRSSETGKYLKDYYYCTYNEQSAENVSIISVSHTISGGNVTFTVISKPITNRVKVSLTSDRTAYLKYTNSYTVNKDGNYVWNLTIPAPSSKTDYSFDSRNISTGSYYKDYFNYTVDPSLTPATEESEIKYITHSIVNNKIYFTVITEPSNLNRVKIMESDGTLMAYTNNYKVDLNGNYEWLLVADVPEHATEYLFDVRSASSGSYLKINYRYSITENDLKQSEDYLTTYIKSISTEITKGSISDRLVFTVVTTPDVNRVKVSFADDLSSYITYTNKYTVDNESYVWTISIDKPLYSTKFAFDVRVKETNKYSKDLAYCDYIVSKVDEAYWNTVDSNGIYTFANGGVQIDTNGWLLYDQYGVTLVARTGYPVSCACINIYDAESEEVFENKTVEDFEHVLGKTISSFEKTTIGNGYTCYVAKSQDGTYFTYVFETQFNKYFINFIQTEDGTNVAELSQQIMDSIVIFY